MILSLLPPVPARAWALAGAGATAVLLLSCRTPPPAALQRFEVARPEMGVEFRVVVYADDEAVARRAATAALDRVRELNAVFSDYEDDSELSRLSRTAGTPSGVPVSPELFEILAMSQEFAQRTDGAFDVTVGPYVNLWRRARRLRELPRPDLMERARAAVGHHHLVLDAHGRTVRLLVPGMRLDLGGIAKGWALDVALEVLRRHGIRSALVSGGGDLVVGDPPPGRRGWRVALARDEAPDAPPVDYLLLANQALATSGDLFQYVEIQGRRYSHIVDPQTGYGLTDHSLVSVVAPRSRVADALSTSVSVLGPDAGLRLVESTPGTAMRMIRKPLGPIEITESSRFRRFLAPPEPAR